MLLGISQEKLGNMLGLTFQQIQKYEKGANRIGASRLFELAAILGVSVQYFFVDAPLRETGGTSAPSAAADGNSDGEVVVDFLGSRESIELNRAFMSISKPAVRRSIIELVRSMADDKG
jgi:transcriptional regulator with XRE-family HTH domain